MPSANWFHGGHERGRPSQRSSTNIYSHQDGANLVLSKPRHCVAGTGNAANLSRETKRQNSRMLSNMARTGAGHVM